MKHGIIKSSWFSLHPYGRMDAGYWLEVIEEMKIAKVDPATASNDEVKAAMLAYGARLIKIRTEAKALRDQAKALIKQARALEDKLP